MVPPYVEGPGLRPALGLFEALIEDEDWQVVRYVGRCPPVSVIQGFNVVRCRTLFHEDQRIERLADRGKFEQSVGP